MEEIVDQSALRPAPDRESPDAGLAHPQHRGRPALLDRVFGRDDVTVLRHEILDRLDRARLGDRLDGFVLAVNEVLTNVVLHAGGNGRLVLDTADDTVRCTVTDSGPGIPERYQHPPEVPEAFGLSGRGIWLAHQLCDEVTMATGPIGTTIGLKIHLPG
ncbi:ATP-binding protein [Actinoplanes sp. N902-109]|uniref:ATP-binding protein n=1 Tax=Actinoplanes sp. (strain N902-109) TaxID=649831 RepID=UPI0003294F34|nr:ATP-binding protein [Actinoplanes sp. N902-109]AGL14054.1 ATP-binding region ATPase domain-containing protein [Actinoplanes sp. N902-109]